MTSEQCDSIRAFRPVAQEFIENETDHNIYHEVVVAA